MVGRVFVGVGRGRDRKCVCRVRVSVHSRGWVYTSERVGVYAHMQCLLTKRSLTVKVAQAQAVVTKSWRHRDR